MDLATQQQFSIRSVCCAAPSQSSALGTPVQNSKTACNTVYWWHDKKGQKTKCTAPQYVDFLMNLCQKLVAEGSVFHLIEGGSLVEQCEPRQQGLCFTLREILEQNESDTRSLCEAKAFHLLRKLACSVKTPLIAAFRLPLRKNSTQIYWLWLVSWFLGYRLLVVLPRILSSVFAFLAS